MGTSNSKKNKDITEINIIYNIKNEDYIDLFGHTFVENNKDICKMIIDNEEYELKCLYKVKINKNNILKIKLKGINNITNMSFMFSGCSLLSSLPDISKWNTKNVTNMNYMFSKCSSLVSLPDISKWNTKNVTNMRSMFSRCSSLISLPDISKWNTNRINTINSMFSGCSSLISLLEYS